MTSSLLGCNSVSFTNKETVITAEKESILHLKHGAKSALGERDVVGCWKRKGLKISRNTHSVARNESSQRRLYHILTRKLVHPEENTCGQI